MEVCGWLVHSIIVTKTDRALHIRRADSTLFQEQRVFCFVCLLQEAYKSQKGLHPDARTQGRTKYALSLTKRFYLQVLTE